MLYCNLTRLWGIILPLTANFLTFLSFNPIYFLQSLVHNLNNENRNTAFDNLLTSLIPHTSEPSPWVVKRRLLRECPLIIRCPPPPLILLYSLHDIRNNGTGPDDLTIHTLKNIDPLRLQLFITIKSTT